MPRTNFIDGVTTLDAEYMNALQTHVHDGVDLDGHMPLVDPADHIDWSSDVTVTLSGSPGDQAVSFVKGSGEAQLKADVFDAAEDLRVGGESILGHTVRAHGQAFLSYDEGTASWVASFDAGERYVSVAQVGDAFVVTLTGTSDLAKRPFVSVAGSGAGPYVVEVAPLVSDVINIKVYRLVGGENVTVAPRGASHPTEDWDQFFLTWFVV